MSGDRPTLAILVDAFRHDYLDEARAPFLARLARRCGWAPMRPILGYSDSIRATIFTGAYPDEHGYWMEYCYRPESSPFRGFAKLAALDRLPNDFVQRGTKFALSQTAVRLEARRRGYERLSLRHLPLSAVDRFDWTLRRGMSAPGALQYPTLFDEMTAAGVPWTYLDSSKSGGAGVLRGVERLPETTAFAFVYLHHIDLASHVFGIRSPLFARFLRHTDGLVRQVIERFQRRFGEHRLLVFSDHGMSEVTQVVSYQDLIHHPSFPHRFCFALDATMVRLWFEEDDPGLKAEIRQRVADGAPGRFLSREELGTLHLDFDHRLYGDEIYLLEPKVAIFPNFHSMQKPRAMHAYHPDDPDQHGIFIAPEAELPHPASLADIHAQCARSVTAPAPA